ncbi:DUF1684 domain-containing protein [Croceitalea rosinachiae]|uniref:DUF1684 domain-containing protein n=1 Tax=Croceitalea rosinachiae TaxID=3075596 RepID=A0ABU3AE62_9FLAO|nr:DUF1684 domain-containing protein [Croceitalea sp. F388]MDT0608190.1 DUF1684 domain-containing protein [Croceitalea sp. F388]
MKQILPVLFLIFFSCKLEKKYHDKDDKINYVSSSVSEILAHREKLNGEFKNPDTSPLPDRYRKDFEGLDFFAPDTNYIIRAKFERTPDAVPFLMSTTTDEKSWEVIYGIAHFELNGLPHKLEIYQSPNLIQQKIYKNYLFLPFLDETNGEETYGGGRYIDLTIPDGDSIEINFNKAYNPYCVYNKKYSCPLVPRQNYLKTRVLAGVKDFNKK